MQEYITPVKTQREVARCPPTTMDRFFCIDTGTTESGYALIAGDYSVIEAGKVENERILEMIDYIAESYDGFSIVFERFAPQQSMGKSTLDSIVWYGRFMQRCIEHEFENIYEIYRRDVKKHLLGKFDKKNGSADTQIRRALVERFAKDVPNGGKGNKASPGWFYGFAGSDMYAAYAVGVTCLDYLMDNYKRSV